MGVPITNLVAHERALQQSVQRTTTALNEQTKAQRARARAGEAKALKIQRRQESAGRPLPAHHGGRMGAAAGEAGGGGSAGSVLAGGAVARFGAAAAGIGGAAYVVGDQIRRAAKSSMSFERSMIEVSKATDASGADLDAYGEKVLSLARATGKTKEELATMLSSAGFAGRPKAELMDFTEYAAKATVAWRTNAEETGQALAEIGNIYDAPQKRIEEIGDAINTMADNSASSESDLLEIVRRAGASYNLAGISAEPLLAFGAALKSIGVRNEVAGTGLEALLNVMKLGEEFSKSAGEGIKDLGYDSDKLRKAFVAKPVETMIGLLEKLNKVSDPLKKAEIMTNMFGKEYQDDIAKLLNVLPKLNEYLGVMKDKAKIASGGVRFQFGQNLDKDVSKVDRATASIDVLYKRLGDPIKVGLGGLSEGVNEFVDKLEKGDTLLQRIVGRLNSGQTGKNIELPELNGEGGVEKWFEKQFPYLSGKVWNEAIDKQIGKTGADTKRLNEQDALARKTAEEGKTLNRPAEIERDLTRQRAEGDRNRSTAPRLTGRQQGLAREAAKRSDAEVARLEGELVKAREAAAQVEASRAAEKREFEALKVQTKSAERLSGFQPGGARGDAAAITPGLTSFGFGRSGTNGQKSSVPEQDPNSRRVPLPPARPTGITPPLGTSGTIDTIGDVLGREPIKIKVDTSQMGEVGTAADTAKQKLAEISGITVSPQGNTAGIDSVTASARAAAAALREVIALGGQAQVSIGKVNAANLSGGTGNRSGDIAQRMQNSFIRQG
nr:phage tail tape measure protein [Methylobacterium sp. OTU13CASTA1]